jgi:hypothetical protein
MAAGAPTAATATRASSKLLSGKPKIRKIELLRVTGRAHRGSLLVWADVAHAQVRPGAKAARRATHAGMVRVELSGGGSSASSTDRFRLPVSNLLEVGRVGHGYRVRIPRRRAKALGSGPIEVRVRAIQRLDLNGDGRPDATSSNGRRARLKPTPLQEPLLPPAGAWSYRDFTTQYIFNTLDGDVTTFSALSLNGRCMTQDPIDQPVDPESGEFTNSDGEVNITGGFNGNGTAQVSGTVVVGTCYQDLLHGVTFSLAQ